MAIGTEEGVELLSDTLQAITSAGMAVFVVAGMASMGLSLTMARIAGPLRDPRVTIGLLAANFVVVPIVAIAAARVVPMEPEAATAIVLIGCAAGAPFLPKLAQLANGDEGLAVGAMVLLMVITIIYAPIVVPLAVEGATVDPLEIAQSLIVLMLIPLAIGLGVRARYESLAEAWSDRLGQASTVGLLFGMGGSVLLAWRDILGAIGTGIFIAAGLVLLAGLAAGWLLSLGRRTQDRTVAALATAQRNIAAAIVIAAPIGGDTLVYTLVGALVLPAALIVLAGELGRRAVAGAPPGHTDDTPPRAA